MIRTKDQRDIYELLKFKEAMSIDQIAFELGITTDRVQIAIRYLQAQQKLVREVTQDLKRMLERDSHE